jgi:superfamily II DNA or RNA helicase
VPPAKTTRKPPAKRQSRAQAKAPRRVGRKSEAAGLWPATLPALDEPFSDRAYQILGVGKVVCGLQNGGRGQLRAACGTGKTRMSQWAAQYLVHLGGVVVIVAPTIGLVAQTLNEWTHAHTHHRILAVCSDPTVASDEAARTEEFLQPVTTDPDVIDAWLRRSVPGQTSLIVGTLASADTIGEGLHKADMFADLLVVDEAHRSAGWAGKHATLIHDDEVVPALRRLYMTATARVWPSAKAADEGTYSMDDENVFGPVLFDYPFSEAISDGWLDDYRLAIIGVTRTEVLDLLRRARASDAHLLPSEHAAMVQAATARAAKELGLRRVLAFCPRVAAAQQFAATFAATIQALPPHMRPSRPLHAEHVDGTMKQNKRRDILSRLATPPDDGWSVISNARCLSEGIDVPAVDGVAFTAKKESMVEIVQAVGRALRRDPDGSGTATIIVPILLPDEFTGSADDIDAGDYETLWQVVRALRAHDDSFAEELDNCRANGIPRESRLARVEYMLPQGVSEPQFLEHLTIRIVQSGSSPWWDGYAALTAYHTTHGDCLVPLKHVTDSGYCLGSWVNRTRAAHRGRRLSAEQYNALARLGFIFNSLDEKWERHYATAAKYREQHGDLNPDKSVVVDGFKLKTWLLRQLEQERRGLLSQDRKTKLERLGVTWHTRGWEAALAKVRKYHQRYGHILNHHYTPVSVEQRILREAREMGELPQEIERELEQLGFSWKRERFDWWDGFALLQAFHRSQGHASPANRFVTKKGFALGQWVVSTRLKAGNGSLSEEQADALAEFGFVDSPTKAHWEHMFAAAQQFASEHGHLRAPKDVTVDSPYLPGQTTVLQQWLKTQDFARKQRTLAADREQRLTALGMEWSGNERLMKAVNKLRAFHAEHHYLPAGAWTPVSGALTTVRRHRKAGVIPDEIIVELDGLGIDWHPAQDVTWREGYERLCRRHTELGHSATTIDLRMPDGYAIGRWARSMRTAYKEGKLAADRVEALRRIDFPFDMDAWDKWEIAFTAAAAFYARNGHLHVPTDLQIANVRLHSWLAQQRAEFHAGTLDKMRKGRLTKIGMQWDIGLALADRLPEIEAFHAVHGHLPTLSTHRSFAWTLSSMRTAFRGGRLPEHVARSLDQMGIDWDTEPEPPTPTTSKNTRTSKEDLHQQVIYAAARFREKHGHLLPQPSMAADVVIGKKRLSVWLQVVRREFKTGRIDPGLCHQLDDLGMVWSVQHANFEHGLEACAKFYAEHGHLTVPAGHTFTNLRGEQASLPAFIHYYRHRRAKLSNEQVVRLDEVGMVWDPNTSRWKSNLEDFTRFQQEYGHLDIPEGFTASSGIDLHNALNYYRWSHRDGTLPPERRDALDKLGMDWTAGASFSRYRMLEALRKFHAEHGHINVPTDLRTSRGAVVTYWLIGQRTKRRKGQLTAEEVAELDALGMDWRLNT